MKNKYIVIVEQIIKIFQTLVELYKNPFLKQFYIHK